MRRFFFALLAIFALATLSFAQVPTVGHVFLVVEENHSYSSVIGSSSMPYLNSLASKYGLATQYYANTHPSIGNYFMMTDGQILTNDDSKTPSNFPVSADNIVRHLMTSGKTWKSYAEGLPSVGYTGGNTGYYLVRHNPFAYFTDVLNSSAEKLNLVPFTQFATDLANNQLPNFSYIAPNIMDDAHNGTLQQADTWLQNNIAPLLASPVFQQDGILFIVFDESVDTDTARGGGKVAMLVISPKAKAGYKSTTVYQHQNLLRTMMTALGLTTFPGAAATAAPMSEFFGATPPPPPAGVTVNVSSPINGATVTSPTTFNSTASGGTITGWRIYVDGTSAYSGGATSSITAPVTMTAGTHQVIVRAWNSTGAYGSANLTLTAGAPPPPPPPEGVTVNVASPTNGATVNSPATFNSTATGGTITGWNIYVDGTSAYSGGATSSITAPVTMATGTHQVIVRAWNSTGAYGSANMTLTVGSAPPPPPPPPGTGPMPPSNAIVLANAEKTNSWGSCSSASCSGGNVASSYSVTPFQTTPSLDGSSTKFTITGGAYANDLFWTKPGNNATPSHFIVEWDVYTDSATYNLAEALEFDFIQVSGGMKFNFSSQCEYTNGTWDTWNEATQHWVHSNVPCTRFAPNTWHHVKWYYERVGAQTHYISITVDGVTYPVDTLYAWQPAPATTWTNGALIFQVQQDLNSKGGTFTQWVNRANIYMW